jgi:hypothetical protein
MEATTRERRTLRRMMAILAAVGLMAAMLAFVAPGASAALPNNGCPEGFDLISVAQAESEGNRVARIADEFAGPPPGNHDGYACRRLLGDGIFHQFPGRPDNVYHWMDNMLP